jgi:acetoin:2,6-dichlorophenolindophenol oxidoreductase subunit alpha
VVRLHELPYDVLVGNPAAIDPVEAYRMMVRMRSVEKALSQAWADGLVPGEYHSAIGEEGINAGVILHLSGKDAMALDHRNTSPFIARGAELTPLMLEVMGSEEGTNHGRAGHMHLMEPELHAAADGIVGSSAPLAVGQAIAITRLHPGCVAIAFHGEGAMNQGMLMEAYNMSVAWNLPVVFVCKDNKWSITTRSTDVTGGDITERARAFGLTVKKVRGDRVEEVYTAAGTLIQRARDGKGPGFLYATCHRPSGHFEGDPIVRMLRKPRQQAGDLGPSIVSSATAREGGTKRERAAGLKELTRRGALAARDWTVRARLDPVKRARRSLGSEIAQRVEAIEQSDIDAAMTDARSRLGERPTFGSNTESAG